MQLRMKVIKGKPRGHCLVFPIGKFMFGRGPECDVRPNSDLISRQHCLLQVSAQGALIRDLGSRNGTLINGQLLSGEHPLANGDTLQLGPLVLEVLIDVTLDQPSTICLGDTALINKDETAMQTQNVAPVEKPVEDPAPSPR